MTSFTTTQSTPITDGFATPYLNDIDTQDPDPAKDPFYVITSKDDVCLGDNNNDLREKNLIGVTNAMYSKLKNPVVDKKYVSMQELWRRT